MMTERTTLVTWPVRYVAFGVHLGDQLKNNEYAAADHKSAAHHFISAGF